MGGTYGDPIAEAPTETGPTPMVPGTVEVESERGLPKPINEVLAVLLDSLAGG
jgi:hypothetical protein